MSMVQTPEDVRQILGLSLETEPRLAQLTESYSHAIRVATYPEHEVRLAFKIARDNFYRPALLHYGSYRIIEEAGFFDDGLAPGAVEQISDPDLRVTPLAKISKNIVAASSDPAMMNMPWAVLLTTGAFAP